MVQLLIILFISYNRPILDCDCLPTYFITHSSMWDSISRHVVRIGSKTAAFLVNVSGPVNWPAFIKVQKMEVGPKLAIMC